MSRRGSVWTGAAIALALACGLLTAPMLSTPAYAVEAARDLTHAKPKKKPLVRSVLTLSVDGLNPDAIVALGPSRAPNFYRLMTSGAWTFNARTAYESTSTLPNHTGMVTGRPVDTRIGGHGVTFNEDNGSTVPSTAGYRVKSVFSKVHRKLGTTALFASKSKFDLLNRSWPKSIDAHTRIADNDALVDAVVRDLDRRRKFRFVHLSAPDSTGHASGYMSANYLTAVAETDARLGRIMAKIKSEKRLRKRLLLLVTSDHGGLGTSHADASAYVNYRIPFFAWGRRVHTGSLYAINPAYADPGTGRPTYTGRQPIRNADITNLTLKVLGLRPLKASRIGTAQLLMVHAAR